MVGESRGGAGDVGVIRKHHFLRNSVVELHARAMGAVNERQRIARLAPDLLFGQKVIRPRLQAEVERGNQAGVIADSAEHSVTK